MPYGRSRLTAAQQMGDPFLGGIIRGIGRVAGGFISGGPLGAVGGLVGALRGGPPTQIQARRLPPAAMFPQFQQQPVSRRGSPRLPAGRPASRLPGDAPRRRRMNPLNVKALRRSTRRLAGFQREAKKVEKQLRKIAPQRRSSSRRDLGPGHRHVR